jgi:hypothetical protein
MSRASLQRSPLVRYGALLAVLVLSGLVCIFVLGPIGLFAIVRSLRAAGFDSESPARNLAFAVMLIGIAGVNWVLVKLLDPIAQRRFGAAGFMDWVNHGPGGGTQKPPAEDGRD